MISLNRNFIFELCQANLEEFITKKYNGVMPGEIEGLYQMASGLKFIHEKKMIHRDIKPENVLISFDGQRACLKIADLGFTKPLNEDGIHYDLASGLKGTEYYMAPELLVLRNLDRQRVLDEKCTTASDVFAAGCTFFRYCAGGVHPFGHDFNIERNIVTGNLVNVTGKCREVELYLETRLRHLRTMYFYNCNHKFTAQNIHIENGEDDQWIIDLVAKMVKLNPIERPSFSEIVELLEDRINSRSFLQNLSGK
jgi:serine/threonine protein kinase